MKYLSNRKAYVLLFAFVFIFLSVVPITLPTMAQSEPRPVAVFGPISMERATGKPVNQSFQITLPELTEGPFTIQLVNGSNGAPAVTSAQVTLNEESILGPSDFKRKATYLEREVNLEPENTLYVSIRGKPGSRIEVTIMGFDTTPEVIVLSEERGEIGPGGGIQALQDVGEIELFEDVTRPLANLAVRNLQAPAAQELLQSELSHLIAVSYLDTVFEIESDVEITTDSAIRVIVPPGFAEAVPQDQDIGLYVLLDDGEGLSFELLETRYDPATGIAVATVPPGFWRKVEVSTETASTIRTAFAADVNYVLWSVLATSSPGTEGIASARFLNISGMGGDLAVEGNELLILHVEAEVVGRGTLHVPFDGASPPITQGYGGAHLALDYGTNARVVAAHEGRIRFDYQTSFYQCRNPLTGLPISSHGRDPDGRQLYGYGFNAVITNYDHDNRALYSTRYAHLDPGSNLVANGGVGQGTAIATAGNSGCATGDHLHFEYWRGTRANENPRNYYPGGANEVDQFKVGLILNGKPLQSSVKQLEPGQLDYIIVLDLSQEPLVSGRYPLELMIIDPDGMRETLDWATLIVGASPLRVKLQWDKVDTDVDLHVSENLFGGHAWYGDLCGIFGGCLDHDDVDGFGPEIFTLTSALHEADYTVSVHYYSDHGNGSTNANVVVEMNGRIVEEKTVYLTDNQWVDIGTYTPVP